MTSVERSKPMVLFVLIHCSPIILLGIYVWSLFIVHYLVSEAYDSVIVKYASVSVVPSFVIISLEKIELVALL